MIGRKRKSQPAFDDLTDEGKKLMIKEAMTEIESTMKKYGVELGTWLNRKDVEKLFLTFKQTPNITEWKLDPQIRKE